MATTPTPKPAPKAAAKPAAPDAPAVVEQPAALLRRTVRAALPMTAGHTDNNGVFLASKDRREWVPTMGEWIGAVLEGVVLYTGPDRPRTLTKASEWSKVNTGEDVEKATVRGWYGSLHRLDAAARHAAGCKAMGWKVTDAVARYQPTRDDLAAIDAAADPMAELLKLATTIKSSAPGSADGLTPKQRTELDSMLRPVIKAALKGGNKWGGPVTGLAHDYTQEALLASIQRLTKDNPDAVDLVNGMRNTLTALAEAKAKALEESRAAKAKAAEEKAAEDAKPDDAA